MDYVLTMLLTIAVVSINKPALIDTETDYDTGLNYTSDANYIIFRDIALGGCLRFRQCRTAQLGTPDV